MWSRDEYKQQWQLFWFIYIIVKIKRKCSVAQSEFLTTDFGSEVMKSVARNSDWATLHFLFIFTIIYNIFLSWWPGFDSRRRHFCNLWFKTEWQLWGTLRKLRYLYSLNSISFNVYIYKRVAKVVCICPFISLYCSLSDLCICIQACSSDPTEACGISLSINSSAPNKRIKQKESKKVVNLSVGQSYSVAPSC